MIRLVLCLSMLLLMLPGAALACACCAERGARFEYSVEMDQWQVGELAGRQAAGPAHLFMTACGLDCVKGVDDPQETYNVEIAVSEAGIEFDLSDAEGVYRGTLGMNWPAEYIHFGADIEPVAQAPDAQLYTEIRFRGTAYGYDGDFDKVTQVDAELVLAGFNNMCFDAGGLTSWSLSVADEGVDFRLFGGLEPK